jgi:Xaa-Pro aminopeptidase
VKLEFQEIEEKTERLVVLCAAEGLAGVLINSQPNFSWLSGGGTNGVDRSREAGVATLFVRRDGRRFIIASRIEMPRMLTEEVNGQGYEPIEFPWEQEKGNASLVVDLARSVTSDELPIGSDLSFVEARSVEGAIARSRFKLTSFEVDRLKALGRDAGEAIGRMARGLAPDLSEREVARRANDALASVGADSVVTLVAADERLERFRHPVPTDLLWKKVLMIVVCARRHGLIVSLTRIVCVGPAPEVLIQRTRAAATVNAQLFAATRPDMSGSKLYDVAVSAYRDVGYAGEERKHHQGGAAGYRTRDWLAHPQCKEEVLENQAFAWNPSIAGTKIEETCIVFKDGIEIITATPGWPTVDVQAEGVEYSLPNVLSI